MGLLGRKEKGIFCNDALNMQLHHRGKAKSVVRKQGLDTGVPGVSHR